ncbi:hypothetical protein HYU09_04820 [Candidatus Woesearchaeota archaeon]|nr:hypothetical protein [Candidatus Woesearchaeota archaeon]
MASFAEIYLSGSAKKEISQSVSRLINKSSEAVSKAKGSISRFFLKAEDGIEKLLGPQNQINVKNIEMKLSRNEGKKVDYAAKENPLARFLKNMYGSSAKYSKKAYGAIEEAGKKVDTFVKLTLLKIIRVYERILAQLNPQWNRVMGSPEDLDTHALAMSQKESVSSENARYQTGYEFLRYRA